MIILTKGYTTERQNMSRNDMFLVWQHLQKNSDVCKKNLRETPTRYHEDSDLNKHEVT
jgi:hypothetical protein